MFRKRKTFINLNATCSFCEKHLLPKYSEVEVLKKFLSERGKILSAKRSGVCHTHQRILKQAIKQSRFLALLPNPGSKPAFS